MDKSTASTLVRTVLNLRHPDIILQMPLGDFFGVFTTIHRQGDIHGCMGEFSKSGGAASPTELYQMVKLSLYNAVYKDDRRKNLCDLELDPDAKVTWNFLVHPYTNLRETDYRPSRNGILVAEDGRIQATFLPGVFSDDTPFTIIQSKLLEKANVSSPPSNFYMYTTFQKSYTLRTLLMPRTLICKRVVEFSEKVLDYWRELQSLPFERERGKVRSDQSEHVRNSALLYTLFRCDPTILNWSVYESTVLHYLKEYEQDPTVWRQASAFLALCVSDPRPIFRKLWQQLQDDMIIDPLEKYEIMWSLAHSPQYSDRLKPPTLVDIDPNNDIFIWNWVIQTWCVLGRITPIGRLPSVHNLKKKETNELAVMYEAFSGLLRLHPTNPKVQQGMFATWVELERRNQDGLYAFKSGNCRIDITAHVISGILNQTEK